MQKFNLAQAKAGKKLITGNGRPVKRFIHLEEVTSPFKCIAVIDGEVMTYKEDGIFLNNQQSGWDLYMAEEEEQDIDKELNDLCEQLNKVFRKMRKVIFIL